MAVLLCVVRGCSAGASEEGGISCCVAALFCQDVFELEQSDLEIWDSLLLFGNICPSCNDTVIVSRSSRSAHAARSGSGASASGLGSEPSTMDLTFFVEKQSSM